ncbi:MAG: PHP domain-containing protein [Desulfobacteraceae bacterium]|jgi:putative hydrolase|nr:PHP domain-containing protein [Desulfobacteraceae bacterium]
MHLHTNFTDGKASIAQVIRRAEELGLTEIAFTEHVRADSDWFPRFVDEIRRLAETSTVRVLVGAEVRITDFEGSLDISSAIRRQCDIILGSVHRFPGKNGQCLNFADIPKDEFADIEYRLSLGLIQQGSADVLAHPGGMSSRYLGGFPDDLYLSLMAEAKRSGMAIEINSSYIKDFKKYLSLLEKTDPYISIGSDVHLLSQLGECQNRLKEILWGN